MLLHEPLRQSALAHHVQQQHADATSAIYVSAYGRYSIYPHTYIERPLLRTTYNSSMRTRDIQLYVCILLGITFGYLASAGTLGYLASAGTLGYLASACGREIPCYMSAYIHSEKPECTCECTCGAFGYLASACEIPQHAGIQQRYAHARYTAVCRHIAALCRHSINI